MFPGREPRISKYKIYALSRAAALFAFSLLSLFLSSFPASAGPIGSGGGVGIVCVTEGKKEVFLADTFALRNSPALNEIKNAYPEEIMAGAVAYFEKIRPQKEFPHPQFRGRKVSIGWLLAHTWAGFNFNLVRSDLDHLNDDHIDAGKLPLNCHKEQIAVQNFARHQVLAKQDLILEMTYADRGFLELHETLLALRGEPGKDTTPIRQAIMAILDNPGFDFQNILKQIIEQRNHHFTFAPTHASRYFSEHCPKFWDSEPAKTPECVQAWNLKGEEWMAQHKAAALPTLTNIPARLDCQITADENNDFDWHPFEKFTLLRTAGDGRPNKENNYSILPGPLDGPFARQFALPTKLSVQPHDRQNGFADFGGLRIVFIQEQAKAEVALFLDNYEPVTGEFSGDIQKTPLRIQGIHDEARPYSSFRILCADSNNEVKFGVDRE